MELAEQSRVRIKDQGFYASYVFRLGEFSASTLMMNGKGFFEEIAFSDRARMRVGALENLAAAARREMRWADAETYYQTLIGLPERDPSRRSEDYLKLLDAFEMQGKDTTYIALSILDFAERAPVAYERQLYRMGKVLMEKEMLEPAVQIFERIVGFEQVSEATENAYLRLAELHVRWARSPCSAASAVGICGHQRRSARSVKSGLWTG